MRSASCFRHLSPISILIPELLTRKKSSGFRSRPGGPDCGLGRVRRARSHSRSFYLRYSRKEEKALIGNDAETTKLRTAFSQIAVLQFSSIGVTHSCFGVIPNRKLFR